MTEKTLGLLQALATLAVSLIPILVVTLRDTWMGRRKVHFKRARDPP